MYCSLPYASSLWSVESMKKEEKRKEELSCVGERQTLIERCSV